MRSIEQIKRMVEFQGAQLEEFVSLLGKPGKEGWEDEYTEDLVEGAEYHIRSFLDWWYEGQGSDESARNHLLHAANYLGMAWDKVKRHLPDPIAKGDFWDDQTRASTSEGQS